METSVMEYAEVYAVEHHEIGLSNNRIIDAVYVRQTDAKIDAARKQQDSTTSESAWGVVEWSVTSLLQLPKKVSMLFVVYESDARGIRPVSLYAVEQLAQLRNRELEHRERIRRMTVELAGEHTDAICHWWEVCPIVQ